MTRFVVVQYENRNLPFYILFFLFSLLVFEYNIAQSASFQQLKWTEVFKAEENIVPNLEAEALDGNAVKTPRQLLEPFQQFTKRANKIDISPLLKRKDATEPG